MLSDEERDANKCLYEIIGVALHSETRDPMMVYHPLYDDGGMYVRPLDISKDDVIEALTRAGYEYNKDVNQFR